MNVAVLGDAGCGKTSLIRALVGLDFDEDSPPTEARTSYNSPGLLNGTGKSMVFVDCGPIEDEIALRSLLKGAHFVVLAYDCTDSATYDSICGVWLSAVRAACWERKVSFVLVGCKSDLFRREVMTNVAEAFAEEERLFFVETSARTLSNINQLANILKVRILQDISSEKKSNGVHSATTTPVKSTDQPTTLRIHRTGSVDLTSKSTGLNFHLSRNGALVSGNQAIGVQDEPENEPEGFPLLVDVKMAGGNIGTIIVQSRDDDPLELAKAFLQQHGLDLRRAKDLANVVTKRLEEYFEANPPAPAHSAKVNNRAVHSNPPPPPPPPPLVLSPARPYASESTQSLSSPARMNGDLKSPRLSSNKPPPPPPQQAPSSSTLQSPSTRPIGRILARLNVTINPDLGTVVAVREGDDAGKVVEAFRRTYNLNVNDPIVLNLLDQVIKVLRDGIPLDDTLILASESFSYPKPNMESPIPSLRRIPEHDVASPQQPERKHPEEHEHQSSQHQPSQSMHSSVKQAEQDQRNVPPVGGGWVKSPETYGSSRAYKSPTMNHKQEAVRIEIVGEPVQSTGYLNPSHVQSYQSPHRSQRDDQERRTEPGMATTYGSPRVQQGYQQDPQLLSPHRGQREDQERRTESGVKTHYGSPRMPQGYQQQGHHSLSAVQHEGSSSQEHHSGSAIYYGYPAGYQQGYQSPPRVLRQEDVLHDRALGTPQSTPFEVHPPTSGAIRNVSELVQELSPVTSHLVAVHPPPPPPSRYENPRSPQQQRTPANPPPPPPSKYTQKPSPVPFSRTPQTPVAKMAGSGARARTISPAVRTTKPISNAMYASPVSRSYASPATRTYASPATRTHASPAPRSFQSPAGRSVASTAVRSQYASSAGRASQSSGMRRTGRPLFYVDVNLGGKSERVAVHKGDNLAEVAERFIEENNISKTKTLKLTQLLEYHMRLHQQSRRPLS